MEPTACTEPRVLAAPEYRNVSLSLLHESTTNPRRIFEETALQELAASIRTRGVLSPLLVRPITEDGFEIVFGARRYRAALLAEAATVPVRIQPMTDAEALEAQLVENLQRQDVHPLEEAHGFHALLHLDAGGYTIEQVAAKMGKTPAYVLTRLKLTDLTPAVIDAFRSDAIGLGHALLLAKLPPEQQDAALPACSKEVYNGGAKPVRLLLPVRNLQFWIETNIVLALKEAPFDRREAQLVPAVGSCVDCPKRTGHNRLLFADLGGKADCCTDPVCYQSKVAAHVAKTLAAKPHLVQISTAYGASEAGSATLSRNRYTEIHTDKPKDADEAKRPEWKVCKFTTEAIVTEGSEVGTLRKVCPNLACPVHHPQRNRRDDERWKAEQDKQRREQAIAQTAGVRVLAAVGAAVPVRLLKRDLLFLVEVGISLLDESRVETLARQQGIRQKRDEGGLAKALLAFLRRADEGTLSRALVQASILLAASRHSGATVLRDAATLYRVDTAAITLKVKQEFAAKAKAKKEAKPATKTKKAA